MAISKADFLSFIIELVMRNPNLGIPALEDGLFANSLIFDYLYNEGNTRKGFIGSIGRGEGEGERGWGGPFREFPSLYK